MSVQTSPAYRCLCGHALDGVTDQGALCTRCRRRVVSRQRTWRPPLQATPRQRVADSALDMIVAGLVMTVVLVTTGMVITMAAVGLWWLIGSIPR